MCFRTWERLYVGRLTMIGGKGIVSLRSQRSVNYANKHYQCHIVYLFMFVISAKKCGVLRIRSDDFEAEKKIEFR